MDTAIIDVTGFVDRLAASAAGASREAAREAQAELGRPLRLAVAGRVSTGKSTIVNALLGQDVAPTSAGECTRVAASFSRGPVERAEVRTLDGRRLPLSLTGSRLPDDLPVRPDEVDGIDVELMIAALDGLEVVDTPGLESLSGYDAATRRALERADALVLVLDPTGIRERDLALVRAFRGASRSGGAARVVLVLNKVDLLVEVGAGLDAAIAAGRRLVERQLAPAIGAEVSAIVPAVGVVAAAVGAGVLRQSHVAELASLAQPDAAAPPSTELRRVLGDIGVAHAASLIAAGEDGELRAALLASSGFGVVRAILDEVLLAHRSTIKRVAVLERLEVLLRAQGSVADAIEARVYADALGARLDAARGADGDLLGPAGAAEVQALRRDGPVAARLGLPSTATVAELRAALVDRVGRWRALENSGLRSRRQAARVAALVDTYSALLTLVARQPG